MKIKLYLFLLFLCIGSFVQAQTTKVVNITAGNLYASLTETERNTITNLTITGSIDARDFKTMRDNMPLLAELDLKEVTIDAFNGLNGTIENYTTQYQANTIPAYAFYSNYYGGKSSLISVILPSTITALGEYSFFRCSSLKTISIPAAVTKIEYYAFKGCTGLTTVNLPAAITSIGVSAFEDCSSLSSIDIPSSIKEINTYTFNNCTGLISVKLPSTITTIANYAFYNCTALATINLPNSLTTIGNYAFYNCALTAVDFPANMTSIGGAFIKCTSLKSITIPESVTSLAYGAFSECSALKSVTIPASVTLIDGSAFSYCDSLTDVTILAQNVVLENGAFSDCKNLTTVTINSLSATLSYYVFNACSKLTSITLACPIPPKCGLYSFYQVDRKRCTLKVPYGSIARYAAASPWKEFINRKETPGILLSSNTAKLEAMEGSTATIDISSNVDWTAIPNQSWLTISPESGTGAGQKLILTAKANPEPKQRKATITIAATDVPTQEITITQMPAPLQLELTAGGLSSALPTEELSAITDLSITGTIDARDFKTMKDKMPLLAFVDLSNATIAAYSGSEGTSAGGSVNYPANELPEYAFYPNSSESSILRAVVLPKSITSIGYLAFFYCKSLTNIEIPSRVATLKVEAFYNCSSLTSVTLPSTVTTIEPYCFSYCTKLGSLTVEASIPPDLSTSSQVFGEVNKNLCILKVPYGSAQAYRNASQWKDFQNIVEAANGFHASSNNVKVEGTAGSTASVEINANTEWTANSDADWLTLDKTSGSGLSQVITFTAQANPSFVNTRTAYVTLTAPGVNSQNIAVIQSVHPQSPKAWEATPGGLASAFTAEELATIYDLTLTGTIDARDFKTMRDQMPKLTTLNLSEATIVEYTGTEGTAGIENKTYPANTVPDYAFLNKEDDFRNNTTLSSLVLPQSLAAIGQSSFSYCYALQDVAIPPSVTTIGAFAFNGCSKIEQVTIPSSVQNIGVMAFGDLNAVITVDPENLHYMASEGVLFNKDQTQIIQYPASKDGSYTIPSSATTIGDYAFYDCDQLTSVTIPSSVTAIGKYAFVYCDRLNSIYVNSSVPVIFAESVYVFTRYSECILYVPVGSKTAYQTANQWKNFWYIIEINPDLIANAGPDQQINEETIATLNGSVKVNTSGRRVTYKWTAPEGIALSSDTIANPTFTAPKVSSNIYYTFSLTISDGLNYSAADEVLIQVRNVNKLPVANAGPDQTVNEGSWVTLNGSASFDPDNDYLYYEWLATYPIMLNSGYSSSTNFKAPSVTADTNYTIFLRVNDGYSYQTDTVVITVKNINQVPVANVAMVQPVNEGELVTLDARGSIDPDGDALTYKWTAPEGIILSSTTSPTPSFTAPSVESDIVFNFTLVVNDGKVNSTTTQAYVYVRNVPSILNLLTNLINNNMLIPGVPVNYQLYMYDGNEFIHKRDTFALTGDSINLIVEPGYWIGLVSPASDPSAFIPNWSGDVFNWNDAKIIQVPVNGIAYMGFSCRPPQASKTGTGQIAGYIYEKPGDGTKSISIAREENMATANPVKTALVQLYKKGGTIPVASVLTDEQGYYKFDQLEISAYEIQVEIPGFVQSERFPVSLSNTAPATKIWFAVNTTLQVITDNNTVKLSMVKAFPNPTSGWVTISGLTGISRIAVYAMNGKLILQKETTQIEESVDLTSQVAGTYILVINEQRLKVYKK